MILILKQVWYTPNYCINHVQRSVKHKFDFNELKLIFKQFF
jgi:hypothetical protein